LALNELHHKIGSLRRLINPHVVERDHSRVGDLADHTGFLHEAIASLAACKFGGEKLNSDNTRDQGIEGAGHSAVGAHANDFQNFVTADLTRLRVNLHGDVPLEQLLSLG